ncbi:MAG: hypothetical protein QGD93_11710 [Actinomycetota bacterium]|nr:hypothetical protein [Actinomycetota bacterium]
MADWSFADESLPEKDAATIDSPAAIAETFIRQAALCASFVLFPYQSIKNIGVEA